MIKKNLIWFIILVLIVLGAIVLWYFIQSPKEKIEVLIPQENILPEKNETSPNVGTGWSTDENPAEAVIEAVNMALEGKTSKSPDFAIVFASSGSDMKAILSKLRESLGIKTKIYGGTSDSRAVSTNKGFVKVTERGYEQALMEGKRGLAIMTVSSKDIIFGVGVANFSAFPSIQEASKSALIKAIQSAGKSHEELPKVVLITPTIGVEEEVIEGIEEAIGKNIPILGGTTGGPTFAVFGENEIYEKGLSLAVIYTDLPIGWTFEGGFDVKDEHSGIATKVEGQDLLEIDNKPALDIYNQWLGGEIERLFKEVKKPDLIRDLLTLHPIYRKYTSLNGQDYFLFSHPWPKDDTLKDKTVMTSTKIKTGERIHLSHGSWETFVNRIGNLPKNAMIQGNIDIKTKPLLGLGYLCAGILGTIPETEREKLPLLINYANNNAPFIADFTWGEQGYFPGVGNKHGNLLTSFLIIAEKQ